MATELLDTARYWLAAGVATIPVRYKDKVPAIKWEDYKTRLPSDTELQRWFGSGLRNIALVVGWKNLVVIDFDDAGLYARWLIWATQAGGYTALVARSTYRVRTARGVHVYVRTYDPEQNRKLDRVDVKARNGCVLIPPSVHPSGIQYSSPEPDALPMMIEALSSILPAELLLKHTELPNFVTVPPVILSSDPWEVAMNPLSPGDDLIARVRRCFRIEEFFSQRQASGGHWQLTHCPFHDDRRPSFWLDTKRQIGGCFAGCTSKPLDVINLYARLHGLTNKDAIWMMAKMR